MMRTVRRKTIIFVSAFTFLWGQTAPALSPEVKKSVREFMQLTQWSSRPVSYIELNKNLGSHLSPDAQVTLQAFAERYGNEKLPAIAVNQGQGGQGQENIQFSLIQNGESAILTIEPKGSDFATLSGSYKGKDYKIKITYQDLENGGEKLFHNLAQTLEINNQTNHGLARETKSIILSYDQIAKLSPEKRAKYRQSLLKLLESMENVGASLQKASSKKVSLMNWWMPEAFADNDIPCVVAGYTGYAEPSNGYKCILSSHDKNTAWKNSNCGSSNILCNPILYGNRTCIAGNSRTQIVDYGATAKCNATVDESLRKKRGMDAWDNFLEGKTKPKDKSNFEAYKKQLESTLRGIQHECTSGEHLPGSARAGIKAEFTNTCKELDSRVNEVLAIGCEDLKQDDHLGMSNILDCASVVTTPGPGSVVSEDNPEDAKKCKDYFDLYKEKTNENKMNCGGEENGRAVEVRCKNGNIYYRCECTSKYIGKKDNGPLVVRCVEKDSASAAKNAKAPEKKSGLLGTLGDFFKSPTFIMLVGGLAGLLIGNYMMKKQTGAYYDMLNQWANPPVPPPSTPPTSTPPPVPSNNPLPPPSGVR